MRGAQGQLQAAKEGADALPQLTRLLFAADALASICICPLLSGLSGSGSYAIVYAGQLRQRRHGMIDVAVKLLKVGAGKPLRRMTQELLTLHAAQGEGVVKLYGYCMDEKKQEYLIVRRQAKQEQSQQMADGRGDGTFVPIS